MTIEAEKQKLLAAQKDEVFSASIEFIKTLTGMEPPPIEVAPPEVFQPFKDFTEKVCAIFVDTHPQPKQDNTELDAICQDLQEKTYTQAMRIAELEAKLKEKNT